jgi:hypothetical protein
MNPYSVTSFSLSSWYDTCYSVYRNVLSFLPSIIAFVSIHRHTNDIRKGNFPLSVFPAMNTLLRHGERVETLKLT